MFSSGGHVTKMAVACSNPDLHWFALKVRARAEKTAETFLTSRGLDVFCPTYVERRKYSDRIKTVENALFPGYVFCQFDWNNRFPVLSAPNVEYVVGFGSGPTPVAHYEVAAVRAIVNSGTPFHPHPFLRVGQKVRLESGPLADLEGILVGKRGSHRLVVSVDLLQRSVAAEIDSAFVRPADLSDPHLIANAASYV
jgi:transcription antitermination factor NusG